MNVLNAYADALIEASRSIPSVLEKGDLFGVARTLWERILSAQPNNAHALLSKGRYLTMMAFRGGEDPSAGMKILEKLDTAEAEFYLGMGYRRLGDEAKAREKYQKALNRDPSFMPARMALGA